MLIFTTCMVDMIDSFEFQACTIEKECTHYWFTWVSNSVHKHLWLSQNKASIPYKNANKLLYMFCKLFTLSDILSFNNKYILNCLQMKLYLFTCHACKFDNSWASSISLNCDQSYCRYFLIKPYSKENG